MFLSFVSHGPCGDMNHQEGQQKLQIFSHERWPLGCDSNPGPPEHVAGIPPAGCGVSCLILDTRTAIVTVYWRTLSSALALLLHQLDATLTSHWKSCCSLTPLPFFLIDPSYYAECRSVDTNNVCVRIQNLAFNALKIFRLFLSD
jgi:hypothetical protein